MLDKYITQGRAAGIMDKIFDISVSRDKVNMWVRTHLLDSDEGGHVRVVDVLDLARSTGEVCWEEFPAPIVHRVSVVGLHPSEVRDANGNVLRKHAGLEFSAAFAGLKSAATGFEGVWPVEEEKVDEAIRLGGVLCATVKGYVGPGMLRRIVDYERTSGGLVWLHTVEDKKLDAFVGTGLMVPVTPGAKNRWEKGMAPS